MKSKIIILLCSIVGIALFVGAYIYLGPIFIRQGNTAFDDNAPFQAGIVSSSKRNPRKSPILIPATKTIFTENFDTNYKVTETGSIGEEGTPIWWLSSGGYFYSSNGVGKTISGSLSAIDPWRVAYSLSNSLDTDSGYYPQNIFRLVLRSQWKNFQQEAYFKIAEDNLSASPNRNSSNGLLFFNRYEDSFNLYYTGIRVDGYATIKKKINGIYYTLAYKPLLPTAGTYNNATNPDLLPKNVWIGLRSEVKTNPDNTVSIKLYVDNGKTGNWVLAAEAIDDGKTYGGSAFLNAGHAGIRTDFMDVQFNNYKIEEIQ